MAEGKPASVVWPKARSCRSARVRQPSSQNASISPPWASISHHLSYELAFKSSALKEWHKLGHTVRAQFVKKLAERLEAWMQDGRDTVLLIGGADGLDAELKQRADEMIRLSSLTLPHGMARLLLCEQLYRAVSLLKNHPYHRE